MIPPRLIVDNQASVPSTSAPYRIWSNDRNIACQPRASVRVERLMQPATESDRVRYEARMADAYALGLQAYLWGWPMVEAARIRSRTLDPSFRHHAPPNVFHHEWSPADSVFSLFPAPCADQVYSEAFFDVSREPMVLHVPDTRGISYWTAQICNFFTETLANVSSRTIGHGPGNYALVGPNWTRSLPSDVVRVPVDQNIGFILLQLRCDDSEDLSLRVRPVQQGFSLTPLSCLGPGSTAWRTPTLPITDWRRRVPRTQERASHLAQVLPGAELGIDRSAPAARRGRARRPLQSHRHRSRSAVRPGYARRRDERRPFPRRRRRLGRGPSALGDLERLPGQRLVGHGPRRQCRRLGLRHVAARRLRAPLDLLQRAGRMRRHRR